MQFDLLLPRQGRHRCANSIMVRELPIASECFLGMEQPMVKLGCCRRMLDRLLEGSRRLFDASQRFKRESKIGMRIRIVRPYDERLRKMCNRLALTAKRVQRDAEIVVAPQPGRV